VTPKDKDGLDAFSVLVGLTPSGEWKDVTRKATCRLAAGKAPPPPASAFPGPHDLDGSFLVEAFFRTEPGQGNGTLVACRAERGFDLRVDEQGALSFSVRADKEERVSADTPVSDGRWHHVIGEADRQAGLLRLYLDGKSVAERKAVLTGTCRSGADLLVGRSPQGECCAVSLEFLRICLGTLADAKTDIAELYAWEFDGPFLRDFAGNPPTGRRDAGALEAAGGK
jgi:hypothetical protein